MIKLEIKLKEGGRQQVGDIFTDDFCRFGWFLDPEGNKVELWESAEKTRATAPLKRCARS